MEEYLIYIVIASLSVLALIILLYLQSRQTKVPGTARSEVEDEVNAPELPVRPQRGAGMARARMRMAQAQRQQHERPEDSDDSAEEDAAEIDAPSGKIGKKKLAKLQLKAEKKLQREAEEREREEKKVEEEKQWELRKLEDAKEKAEEKRLAEEETLRKEEEIKKEKEEYEEFKLQFSVQEEGFDEIADKDQEDSLLNSFISHIKKSKVVVLEELAALFKLRTQAVINRIVKLQEDGRLTGVIDDRGKFIYISMDELEKVAKFIKQRGRVSLAEIAEASNQLIDLSPEVTLEV